MPKGGTPYMPSQYLLDAYEPRRYMRYFEEITRIPHNTEDEAHLAAYIREVAKTAGAGVVSGSARERVSAYACNGGI